MGGLAPPPPGFLAGPAGGDSKWRERYEKAERALEDERMQTTALRRELQAWEGRRQALEVKESSLAASQQSVQNAEGQVRESRETVEAKAAQAQELADAVQSTVERLLEENDGLVEKLNRQAAQIEELQRGRGDGGGCSASRLPPDITPDDFLALAAEVERLRAVEDAAVRRGFPEAAAAAPSGGSEAFVRPTSPVAITPTGNPSLRVQIPPPLHADEGDSDSGGDGGIAVEGSAGGPAAGDGVAIETEVYVRRRLGLWGYIVGADRLP